MNTLNLKLYIHLHLLDMCFFKYEIHPTHVHMYHCYLKLFSLV